MTLDCRLTRCPRPAVEGDWCTAHTGVGEHVADLERLTEPSVSMCDGAGHAASVPRHLQPVGRRPAVDGWRQLDLRRRWRMTDIDTVGAR